MTESIRVSGTYTVDPLIDVLEFWGARLGWQALARAVPYGQVFQQLLDPGSELRTNERGANVICVRWHDIAGKPLSNGADHAAATPAAAVLELAQALASFEHRVPCLVVVGPEQRRDEAANAALGDLINRLHDVPQVYVLSGAEAVARYGVERVLDPIAERFGHVPFTLEGSAALGSAIARWYAALTRVPVKVIATDCDNTLWSGVVGEDGRDGITIGSGHAALQRQLIGQTERGRVIALLSKNEEADVLGVLDHRADMVLKRQHVLTHRINWDPKPANMTSVAAELELGLDAVVFLDDNPVECAQMREQCPTVMTIEVPTDEAKLARFADHLWLFDQPRVTREDRKRVQMYREGSQRNELKRATSFADFITSLGLRVEVGPPTAADVARVAQLTQRTNQFNTSLIRCDEAQIRQDQTLPDRVVRVVKVTDRFGDYGSVGVMRAQVTGGTLVVDQFLLSCRAMGRGVEHQMAAALGEIAVSRGCDHVSFAVQLGERNAPARRFLLQIAGADQPMSSAQGRCFMPAADVAAVRFDPAVQAVASAEPDEPGRQSARGGGTQHDLGELYGTIARELNTGAGVVAAMAARVRQRPDLNAGFVAPGAGLERQIAHIWQEVLQVAPIGAHDRFADLGGRSIHLVRIHGLLLERLGHDVAITTLFQHATVAALALHIGQAGALAMDARLQTSERSQQMRQARQRATARVEGRR